MFPKRKVYTRWWGPLIGALLGAEVTLRLHSPYKDPSGFLQSLICGVGVGTAAGVLFLFLDPAPKDQTKLKESQPEKPPTLSGNVLCALSLLFFFMPFFNVVLSGLALACNWKVKGWARRLSWMGLLVGLGMTSLIVWHWVCLAKGS